MLLESWLIAQTMEGEKSQSGLRGFDIGPRVVMFPGAEYCSIVPSNVHQWVVLRWLRGTLAEIAPLSRHLATKEIGRAHV